jgi:hypothetical protein
MLSYKVKQNFNRTTHSHLFKSMESHLLTLIHEIHSQHHFTDMDRIVIVKLEGFRPDPKS